MVSPVTTPLPAHLQSCCVVLVRTQGPVNLGMVARVCGNIGITDLRLVQPITEIDCPEARMFSTHNRELLLTAPVYPDLATATADCGLVVGTTARVRDPLAGVPMWPEELPAAMAKRPAARWALVFGNEADGLSDAELRACQLYVRLRHGGGSYSYNLSHAVAIMLYVLAGLDTPPPVRELPSAASREDVERFYQYWLHTLDRFGYFRRTSRERFAPILSQLLNRLHLSKLDLEAFWGMFAQFNYRTFGNRAEPGHDPTGKGRREADEPPAHPKP